MSSLLLLFQVPTVASSISGSGFCFFLHNFQVLAMNATSSIESIQENVNGSDSDTNPDDPPEYYQPISAVDEDEDEDDGEDLNRYGLPNGYCVNQAGNEVASLDLNDDGEVVEEEEEEASEWAIRRAFSEDENRRNAPLSRENAVRVMEAMRGVSFGGVAPDWAAQLPEDSWIDELRRLRQPPRASTT